MVDMCACTHTHIRENSVTPEVEKEAHITQTQWMEIRQIVRCIYRENMMLSSKCSHAAIHPDCAPSQFECVMSLHALALTALL